MLERRALMGMLKLDAVVHWSIPVNNLEEAEKFYGEILGLEHVGRLANSPQSCFRIGGHNIILCQRKDPIVRTVEQDGRLHHAFDVSPEMFNQACKLFHRLDVKIQEPVDYRPGGFFTGRQLFVLDPSGNRIELRDASWKAGMPTPTYEEIVNS
ncbi:MAG: VOC family protein [Deltaproteobacteria bacterium]|nr:MAG: VOC family protein [Deltaproteobacteria bacterium]